MPDLDADTARLRERLGKGARYDAPNAPAAELVWARRGTAYFARQLVGLRDDELAGQSLIPGWSRARLVGHVGNQARALSRIVEAARTGGAWHDARQEERGAEERSATLPARALRHLFDHSVVHLNVEWRDLDDEAWDRTVTVNGAAVAVRDTPGLRARALWLHAIDLAGSGSYRDLPMDLLRWLAAKKGIAADNPHALGEMVASAFDRPRTPGTIDELQSMPRAIGAPQA